MSPSPEEPELIPFASSSAEIQDRAGASARALDRRFAMISSSGLRRPTPFRRVERKYNSVQGV